MRYLLLILLFFICGCSDYNKTDNTPIGEGDTTLIISYNISKKSLKSTNDYVERRLLALYNYIDTGYTDKDFLKYVDALYRYPIQRTFITNNSKLKEISILLFLKLHLSEMKNSQEGFNYGCYRFQYICINLLEITYLQASDCKTFRDPPFTCYVYKWLKENPNSEFYNNPEISNSMSQIDEFYLNNNIDL